MERNLLIELLEDGEKVSLYSPHFEGEEYSEFEKFLLTYKDSYPQDVSQLVYRLDIIKREGAMDRHFRYEGTKIDRVMALPSHLETTSLRLYLLNIQGKILILGWRNKKYGHISRRPRITPSCKDITKNRHKVD